MTIRIEVIISYVGGLMVALLDLMIIGSRSSGWFVEFLTFASLPFWWLAWVTTEFVTGERLFANGLDGATPRILNLLFDGFFLVFATLVIGSVLLPFIILMFRHKT